MERESPGINGEGSQLSDQVYVVSLWKEHFCNLLNRPLHDPPDVLVTEAEAAVPDADIDTRPPPTVLETHRAARRIKAGKAPGACGIYPEYIRYIQLCRH